MNQTLAWLPTDPALLYLLQLQGLIAALVLLAWGVDRMLGKCRPAWRCGLWEMALLGVLMTPLFCWVSPMLPWRIIELVPPAPPAVVAPVPKRTTTEVSKVVKPAEETKSTTEEKSLRPVGVDPRFRALAELTVSQEIFTHRVQNRPETVEIPPETVEAPPVKEPVTPARPLISIYWFLAIWAAGSLILLARLIHGLLRIHSALSQEQSSVLLEDAELLEEVRKRVGLRELPTISLARGVRGPLVLGIVCPRVFLPAAIREQVTRGQLIDILVHECAHVRRRDGLMLLLQHGTWILFWVNPLVWLLHRKLNAAREEVCDNYVLKHTAAPDYAGTLLSIAERCFPVKETSGLLAMMASAHGLELRVIDLLDTARDPATQVSGKHQSALWLLLILVLALLSAIGIQAGPSRENPAEFARSARQDPADSELPKKPSDLSLAGTGASAPIAVPATTHPIPLHNAALAQADPVQTLPGREKSKSDRVKEAIERAVQFLRHQERGRGNWEVDGESNARKGGWTSLALLALLTAGTPTDDPAIQRGLTYLRMIVPEQTYTVGLQTCVFAYAGLPEDQRLVQRNLEWLMIQRIPARANRAGGWGYSDGSGSPDNSNTQYALIGVNDGYWWIKDNKDIRMSAEFMTGLRQCQADLISTQQNDGGWSYRNEPFTSLTMTSAGLAGVSNLAAVANRKATKLAADGSEVDCGAYEESGTIIKALRWLGDSFPERIASHEEGLRMLKHPFYALHGVQRVGRSTGQRFFRGIDWYQVGCDYLLKTQTQDGSWGGAGGFGTLDNWPVVATSFAVLFLSRGQTPVLVSKFAHHGERSWNRKHHDLEHLVPFAAREAFGGKPLAWQVFDASKIPLDQQGQMEACTRQLLETPVVWLSGHKEVPEGNSRRLLKAYLDQGGFLFAEACCASAEFDRSFRQMIKELYPTAELVPLGPDHAIWKASGKPLARSGQFPLYGVVQGGKVKVAYSPRAISGYWEANSKAEGPGLDAFLLGANVIAYATDKKMPLPRLSTVMAAQP